MGDLKAAQALIKERIKGGYSAEKYDKLTKNGTSRPNKIFKSSLTVLNYMAMVENFIKLKEKKIAAGKKGEISTLEATQLVLDTINTYGSVAMSVYSTQILLGKWERFGFSKGGYLSAVKGQADKLATFLGFFGAAAAYCESIQLRNDGKTMESINKFVQGTGLLISSLGYMIRSGSVAVLNVAMRNILTAPFVILFGEALLIGGAIIAAFYFVKDFVLPIGYHLVKNNNNSELYDMLDKYWDQIKQDNKRFEAYNNKTKGSEPITINAIKEIDSLSVTITNAQYTYR
ncbi:MAG: hypothetical protein GY804_06985, partial [Alphaproteobacteria bacterium]|nr:hypothetical protein [Alphaproteobacteria bacterium]